MKLIIDVDTGTDDALAIMIALAQPHAEVLAITCVNGNVRLDTSCHNTLRLLQACDRLDVPVYRGACRPLSADLTPLTGHHGKDGLGDVDIDRGQPVDTGLIKKEPAAIAMISLVNKYPGEVTLVALAPHTNIALAQRLDAEFGKKLKNMLIMGGNMSGKGNITVSGEFNFHCDPEAASVTLAEIQCPIKLVSWETCSKYTLDWDWYNKWINTDTKKGRFCKAFLTCDAKRAKEVLHLNGLRCCDALAIVTLLDENSVVESKKVYCSVELHGSYTRGQMVVDWMGLLNKEPNVDIVMQMDIEMVKKLYYCALV